MRTNDKDGINSSVAGRPGAGLLRRIRLIPVCVLAGILLSACGEEQVSYTKQGMEAVEALEYNEALNCFKNG